MKKGFTLIEIMVAVSVFSMIIAISGGSILSVLNANKKSQSMRSVMDNMNSTLETMTRTIRFGTSYHCGEAGDTTVPADCLGGDNILHLKSMGGANVVYRLNSGEIQRSLNNGVNYYPITSSDVTVTKLSFYVIGSALYTDGNLEQPRVIMVVGGYSGVRETTQSSFTIETTASQRVFDFQ